MSEVLVKFYNTDYVVFYNSNKGEEIIKEDYQDYFVKKWWHPSYGFGK